MYQISNFRQPLNHTPFRKKIEKILLNSTKNIDKYAF
nr:MAG TPA_asm: hypothetical protein [Caudoviricetes sp.]